MIVAAGMNADGKAVTLRRLVDRPIDALAERLIAGQDVKISGFGNFQIRIKAPRPGRNPRTGESIPIEARRVATFHASHKLKDLVQGLPAAEDDAE